MSTSTVIEFAVKMTCKSCVSKVENSLKTIDGINTYEISLERGTVLVDTKLPSYVIQQKIEATGLNVVLKGYGSKIGEAIPVGGGIAAVAMLGSAVGLGRGVTGVVRFVQADSNCIIDGTIDGLQPGKHGLHIHECGDISKGYESVGNHFDVGNSTHGGPRDSIRHTGDLGNVIANIEGRATFRIEDKLIKIDEVIGRSLVVKEFEDDLGRGTSPKSPIDGNSGDGLACGIIARSAGLFENNKTICACDGVTIWDERNKPLTGPGRKTESQGYCSVN